MEEHNSSRSSPKLAEPASAAENPTVVVKKIDEQAVESKPAEE